MNSWDLLRAFFEMPLSKRRELLGDYYQRTPAHLADFKRAREAIVAMKADGKFEDFLRAVAATQSST